jgi:hypothetical protein
MGARSRTSTLSQDEQDSALLSCFANQVPLCCRDGAKIATDILGTGRRRRSFGDFAHHQTSCDLTSAFVRRDLDVGGAYFEQLLVWLEP